MRSLLTSAKRVFPDRARHLPILRGPLRGGSFFARPRVSMRKVLGLYEHELNPWLDRALSRADMVLDVGANDGYFTFGCAAALRRRSKPVKIIAFEPLSAHIEQLQAARHRSGYSSSEIEIVPKLVGRAGDVNHVTLDDFAALNASCRAPLIKIDVEGAEMDVLNGAAKWLSPAAMLLIEVHKPEYLSEITMQLAISVGPMDQVNQRPLPLLGRELRIEDNWWLLSRLA